MTQLTWNEPLASLDGVVAHTVVSAGKNDSLLVEETQIVPYTCPKTEGEVGLRNNSSHSQQDLTLTDFKLTENYKDSPQT